MLLNGKGKWDPPTEKDSQGLYVLGEAPSGTLVFDFCLNPAQLKETEKQIRRLTEAGDLKQVEILRVNQSKPAEVINVHSVTKAPSSDSGAGAFFDMILERYREGDDVNVVEMIINLTKEHSVWFSQAHEALYACKFQEQVSRVGPFLINAIQDSHLRFALAAQASLQGAGAMNELLSSMRASMGSSALYFSSFNPNGRYSLDLGNEVQRDVAKSLMAINKRYNAKIVAKECFDRSQTGNQSAFRNERINGLKFAMHVGTWKLPDRGLFEFDFYCFDQQPTGELLSDKEDIMMLLEWFEMTYGQLTAATKSLSRHQKEATARIGTILGECFRSVAEYFVFNAEYLSLFVELIEDPKWRFLVYTAGAGRMHDTLNFDFIKHRMKNAGGIKETYSSFGIINLFCPFRPNGSYLLRLEVYEERTVCRMLCELAKGEGWANWREVKIDGKPRESLNNDYIMNLPTTGTFEGTFACPPEKEKHDLRMKQGVKYLDWRD